MSAAAEVAQATHPAKPGIVRALSRFCAAKRLLFFPPRDARLRPSNGFQAEFARF